VPASVSKELEQAQHLDELINSSCAINDIEDSLSPNPSWEDVFAFLSSHSLIKLEENLVKQVKAGDRQAIAQLLSALVDTLDESNEGGTKVKENNYEDETDENKKGVEIQQKRLRTNPNKGEEEEKKKVVLPDERPQPNLNLNTIDPKKDVSLSESMLEFVILSGCQRFSMQPKQVAGLLSNNFKLLAQIIIQGLKGV